MDEQAIARCLIWFVIIGAIIFFLDEYSYYQWKKNNPGAMFSLIPKDKPLNPYSSSMQYGGVANGFKPGGSGYVAG